MKATQTAVRPIIRPRETLTKKARAAIERYVMHKAGHQPAMLHQAISWTLEAERMTRAQLYKWLENRGYRWKGGFWYRRKV